MASSSIMVLVVIVTMAVVCHANSHGKCKFNKIVEPNKPALMRCAATSYGLLAADGSVDTDQVHAKIDLIDASPEVKEELVDGIDECIEKQTNTDDALSCIHVTLMKVCHGNP